MVEVCHRLGLALGGPTLPVELRWFYALWAAALGAGKSFSRFLAEVPCDDLPRAPTLPMLPMQVASRSSR